MSIDQAHADCFERVEVSYLGSRGSSFVPGTCRHVHVEQVTSSVTGETLAYLCLCCDRTIGWPRPGSYCDGGAAS
jgi:hypothetical protein